MLDSNKSQDASDEEPFMFECPGQGGSLVVTEKEIIFRRNGGFLSPYKKGEKIIPHTDVVSIQHQKAGFASPGYIYIQLADTPASIKYGAAINHENAIVFMPNHNELYENVYKYLSSKINPVDNNLSLDLHESEQTPDLEDSQDVLSEETFIIECLGEGGSLTVKSTGIIFKRNGGFWSLHKKGEKNIEYSEMVGCQYQKITERTPGYIYFQLVDHPASVDYETAFGHENALIFIQDINQSFDKAYQYIRKLFSDSQSLFDQSSSKDDSTKNDNNESQFTAPSKKQVPQAEADLEDNYSLEDIDQSISNLCPENSAVENISNAKGDEINIIKNKHNPPALIQTQEPQNEPEITNINLVFEGDNGTLILTEYGITIKREARLFTAHPEGEKYILYRNMTAVQLKPVNITLGFIQFSFQGGRESLGKAVDAVSDENTIVFRSRDKEKEFRHAKEMIEQRMREAIEPRPQVSGGSDLDQLEKLASLRDKGIITEDEFQAKKKQILGL